MVARIELASDAYKAPALTIVLYHDIIKTLKARQFKRLMLYICLLFVSYVFGDPTKIRTPATAVKGRCLSHLTIGPLAADARVELANERVKAVCVYHFTNPQYRRWFFSHFRRFPCLVLTVSPFAIREHDHQHFCSMSVVF